jgi:hypothetical protein
MSKAEKRMYECFPNEDTNSRIARFGFLIGYHQAENDLELTWEDVRRIYLLVNSTINDVGMDNLTDKSIYQEVLKRFKERKGE